MTNLKAVATKIEQIENELKRIGFWQSAPLAPEQYDFRQAFAMDTMTFSQWLQFIFIPRVKEIIETKGDFPAESQVATQAVREFDGVITANKLVSLLSEFDELFNS